MLTKIGLKTEGLSDGQIESNNHCGAPCTYKYPDSVYPGIVCDKVCILEKDHGSGTLHLCNTGHCF